MGLKILDRVVDIAAIAAITWLATRGAISGEAAVLAIVGIALPSDLVRRFIERRGGPMVILAASSLAKATITAGLIATSLNACDRPVHTTVTRNDDNTADVVRAIDAIGRSMHDVQASIERKMVEDLRAYHDTYCSGGDAGSDASVDAGSDAGSLWCPSETDTDTRAFARAFVARYRDVIDAHRNVREAHDAAIDALERCTRDNDCMALNMRVDALRAAQRAWWCACIAHGWREFVPAHEIGGLQCSN